MFFRGSRESKAQKMLGITDTDMRIARNESIASTTSSRSHNRQPQQDLQQDSRSLRRREGASQGRDARPETRASSVLLHDEYVRTAADNEPVPPMPIKNFASSSTLHSHYDAQKVPLGVSQQTSESSRRDLALRKGSTRVLLFPFTEKATDKESPKSGKSPRPRLTPEGRKLSKQRPGTSETSPHRPVVPEWRPESGYESVPSSKSVNDAPRTPRSTRFTPSKPSSLSRRQVAPTNKVLLEPMDPACLKVNVRRPKVGAKHWFDGLEGDTSEDDVVDEPEFEQNFVSGLESAFRDERIKPPSDQSSVQTPSVRTEVRGFNLGSSTGSVATPKQFLQSPSTTTRPSPRVAILTAKGSRTSMAQQSTRSGQTSTSRRTAIEETDLTKSSYLNLSGSDDEEEPARAVQAIPVRSPQPLKPAIRDSVALAFNSDSEVEVGTAHETNAKSLTQGHQHSRVRTLKVVNRNSRGQPLQMPIPKRGSSLALSHLYEEAERQSAGPEYGQDGQDMIPSFPPTPTTDSEPSGYRMSVSVFSDTDSIASRRMMSVTKQEESLLAAMRLKKAAMKQNVTRDRRLQALRNLERGQAQTPPKREPSTDSASSFHPRQTYASTVNSVLSRDSGTTFQTNTTARQSRMTNPVPTQMNRLSLSSADSLEHSASPSLLSLNTPNRRESRDTYYSPPGPPLGAAQGHSRHRTDSSHISNIVSLDELDKAPESRDDISSQDFIDWPYRGWNARVGVIQGVAH